MKLASLTIESFRGFAKPYRFDLDSNIILLTGKNGYGKTTFFDACEWALTGQLVRYEKSLTEKSLFPYVANQIAKKEPRVVLEFVENGEKHVLERRGDDHGKSTTLLNEKELDDGPFQMALLKLMIAGSERPESLSFDDLKNLFLKSHLLEQELTSEFVRQLSPSDRFSQLSKILGTERYERFYKDLESSLSFFRLEKNNKDEVSNRIKKEYDETFAVLREAEEEFRRLKSSSKITKDIVADKLDVLFNYFKKDLKLHDDRINKIKESVITSFNMENSELIALETHIISQIHLNERKLSELQSLKNSSKGLTKLEGFVEENEKEVENLNEQISNLQSKERAVKDELFTSEKKLKGLNSKLGESKIKLKIAEVVAQGYKKYEADLTAQKTNEKDYDDAISLASTTRKEIDLAEKELSKRRTDLESLVKASSELRDWIERHKKLFSLNNKYENTNRKIDKLKDEIAELHKKKESSQKTIFLLSSDLKQYEEALSARNAQLAVGLELKKEYDNLLLQLEKFITDPHCPLCGHDWLDIDDLRKQIAKTRNRSEVQIKSIGDTISEETKTLQKMMAKRDDEVAENKRMVRRLEDTRGEIEDLGNLLKDILRQAAALSFKRDDVIDLNPIIVQKGLDSKENSFLESKRKMADLKSEIEILEKDVVSMGRKFLEISSREQKLKEQLSNFEKSLSKYEADLATLNLPVRNLKPDALEKYRSDLARQIDELNSLAATTTQEKNVAERENTTLIDTIEQKKEQLKKISSTIEISRKERESIYSSLARFRIKDIAELDLVLMTIQNEITSLYEKKDQWIEVKGWFSYWNFSDKIIRLRQNLEQIEGRKNKQAEELSKLEQAENHVRGLVRNSKTTLLDVNKKTMESHESLINIFFGQINPHPLFRKIKFDFQRTIGRGGPSALFIKSVDIENENNMNPNLTFSSAQLNVLALSIFLAIHFKQTWSKLETLFLDDPIQNMDDLNILSFIDLLGKIRSNKQIVISTHDTNVAKLIERKLFPVKSEEGIYIYDYVNYDRSGPIMEKRRVVPS